MHGVSSLYIILLDMNLVDLISQVLNCVVLLKSPYVVLELLFLGPFDLGKFQLQALGLLDS
jgi:hypothetical protein